MDSINYTTPIEEALLKTLKTIDMSKNVVNYESFKKDNRYVFDINIDKSYCWYDCHPFKSKPISIPTFYSKNTWYCKGVFCSFSCAKSYCIERNIRLDYLNLLYRTVSKNTQTDRTPNLIHRSPPRTSLKIFGGILDINTFREKLDTISISYTEYPTIHSVQQLCVDIKLKHSDNVSTCIIPNIPIPKKKKKQTKIESILFQ